MRHVRSARAFTGPLLAAFLLVGCGGSTEPKDDLLRLTSLEAGTASTCGLTAAGEAYCWPDRVVRAGLVPGGPVKAVAVGAYAACIIGEDDAARCWGDNTHGTVGDGTTSPRAEPVPVSGGLTFTAVDPAVGPFTCGVATGGAGWCWGSNASGALGTGAAVSGTLYTTPQAVAGGQQFSSITGGRDHACGLTTSGAAWCWGGRERLQLGRGSPAHLATVPDPNPAPVAGSVAFVSISAGADHTCGITAAGAAYCWGDAVYGRLGQAADVTLDECYWANDYDFDCAGTPTLVQGGHTFTSISAAEFHTCAVDVDRVAWCWGRNAEGQLGLGHFDAVHSGYTVDAPHAVTGTFRFTSLKAGSMHTCGIATDGDTYCWGKGEETGLPGGGDVNVPTRIPGQ